MNINTKEGLIWDGRLFFTWLSIVDVEHKPSWSVCNPSLFSASVLLINNIPFRCTNVWTYIYLLEERFVVRFVSDIYGNVWLDIAMATCHQCLWTKTWISSVWWEIKVKPFRSDCWYILEHYICIIIFLFKNSLKELIYKVLMQIPVNWLSYMNTLTGMR